MKRISEVKIGDPIETRRNGKGMVTNKTKRTITVTFENGDVIRITYKHSDSYFYQSDFSH